MKKITFLLLLIPLLYMSQVGINTQKPTETLDVDGTLRIRNISKVNPQSLAPVKDSIMVFEKGVVKRATANQIIKQVDASIFPSEIQNTDNQQITNFKYDPDTHKISLTLEDGGTKEIDLSSLDNNGTDGQQLTLSGNTLTLQNGRTVDLSPYLDNTDDQQITNFKYDPDTHKISLTLEDGGTKEIDLSSLDNNGTDDQQLTLSGNTLTLQNGGTVDLSSYLDNTDDQQITNFKYDPDTHKISLTLEDGGTKEIDLSSLDNNGTDDQQLTLSGNTLTLQNGGTVDLSSYLDNTDDQQITNFKYDPGTHKISLTLEDGGTKEIDLSSLDNNGTDGQQLTLSGNTLTLQNGGTVDLSSYLDNTDDQQITNFKYDPDTHKISLTLEDGGAKEIDLSSLDDKGDDNQQLTLEENALKLERGGTDIDLSSYLDNTDNQTIETLQYQQRDRSLKVKLQNSEEKSVKLATIPVGGIIMWSGSINDIPSGWQLCNGSNGTPDLTDRFIVGASNNIGDTGGNNKIKLKANQIPTLTSNMNKDFKVYTDPKNKNFTYRDTQFRDSDSDEGKEFKSMEVDGHEHYSEEKGKDNNYHAVVNSGGKNLYIYYKNRTLAVRFENGTVKYTNASQKTVDIRPPYYALAFIMFVGS